MTDQPAPAAAGSTPAACARPGTAGDAQDIMTGASAASQDAPAHRTPLRAQLLAALVALGCSALWPGTTPQAPPAPRPGHPHHRTRP